MNTNLSGTVNERKDQRHISNQKSNARFLSSEELVQRAITEQAEVCINPFLIVITPSDSHRDVHFLMELC